MTSLKKIVEETRKYVDEGYYDVSLKVYYARSKLSSAIMNCKKIPIISEIKFASPSIGKIRAYKDPAKIARDMIEGGAVGLSVLTNKEFDGRLDYLLNVRIATDLPLLMKDIIIDKRQIDAAFRCGADCILLIYSLFKDDRDKLIGFIDYAHKNDLEVLIEVHDEQEFLDVLNVDADMIGINNRDLSTMTVDISTTERLLKSNDLWKDRIVISESGIDSIGDIRRIHKAGARAFLIGSSIMKSDNIRAKLEELVNAI